MQNLEQSAATATAPLAGARILLVEDEQDLAELVADWLARDNHQVDVVRDGEEALSKLEADRGEYELIILDLMLPGCNGLEVCRAYRRKFGTAPVLVLTARDSIEDKEIGFGAGADDYMTKPFHLKELSVRVGALLRRSILLPNKVLRVRDIEVDTHERKVRKSGELVHLSPREFHLLEFLLRHPNQVFSSEDLLDHVWAPDSNAMNDTVRGHINRLRKKLDTTEQAPLISNIYGFGYKLNPDSPTGS
ncbi:MAG TPA: response regulator transcription factor [Planktothrix sp.]